MKTTVQLVLYEFIHDLLIEVSDVFDKNNLRDSSVKDKIQAKLELSSDPIISILLGHYIDFIDKEKTTNSSKIPTISEIKDWATKEGLSVTNEMLYAIAYLIKKDGIKNRPILSMIEERIDRYFDDKRLDHLAEAILEDLSI